MKFTLVLLDEHVVDTRLTLTHQTMLIKLPEFIAVTSVPLAVVVVRFVNKTHSHSVFAEASQFFDKSIVVF